MALNELKIRAKKRLKTEHNKIASDEKKPLKHHLNQMSVELGFSSWQHANHVLSGKIQNPEGDDFGAFFHSRSCDSLINQWFSNYEEARRELKKDNASYLLPYKHHFVVASVQYLVAIGIQDPRSSLLVQINSDFVRGYGSDEWDQLALDVIRGY
jgi:hypothetical protein